MSVFGNILGMLDTFENTDLGRKLELDVCTIIVDYVVDGREPEILRSKIFEHVRSSTNNTVFLTGIRQTSLELSGMTLGEIIPYIKHPPTDGSHIFALHATQLPGSINIKMILIIFPDTPGVPINEFKCTTWVETAMSLRYMFLGRAPRNKLTDGNDLLQIDQLIQLLHNTKIYHPSRLLIADDAAKIARFRMSTGRIAMRQCDIPNTPAEVDDVDMFITQDILSQKNTSRLGMIKLKFPDGVADLIGDYAIDQTHTAADLFSLVNRRSISHDSYLASFPDPEDPTGYWYINMIDYRPINILISEMRHFTFSRWNYINPIGNIFDFVNGSDRPILTQKIIEERSMYIDRGRASCLLEFEPSLINKIVNRMRNAIRTVLNSKMNQDMRHIMYGRVG